MRPGKGGKKFLGRQKNTDIYNEKVFKMVKANTVMVIVDESGDKLGEMSKQDAYDRAQSMGLDLVCVAPTAPVPVCKLMDYGKYKFEKQKKDKEGKKKQTKMELKEVRVTPTIGEHDLETKAKQANKFLSKGSKVKVTVVFRGREIVHKEIGESVLMKFVDLCNENGGLEGKPKLEGKRMFIVLDPNKKESE